MVKDNNQNTRKIFISGGGGRKDSFLLDKEFIKSVLVSDKKSILYIPIALERDTDGYKDCYKWITEMLTAHTDKRINITMWTNLQEKRQEKLDKFDAIYIGGGNTFKLLQELYNSNFISRLLEFIKQGKVVYGGSAGAIILGKDINTSQDEQNKKYKYNKGLELIGKYAVFCHYTEKSDQTIINYIKKYNNPIIAIPEKSGLKIENNKAVVIGTKPAIIFNLKREKKIIKTGKEFNYIKI